MIQYTVRFPRLQLQPRKPVHKVKENDKEAIPWTSRNHMPAPEAFEVTADLFKLMSDLTRVRLFWLLCHCEECVLNLSVMMNMSSPALSHHLKLLKACGLIVSRRDGKEVYYRAADSEQAAALHHVIEHVAEIACPQ